MNKTRFFTVLLFCLALFGQAVTAQEFVQDGIRYQAQTGAGSNTATVLGFDGNPQTNLVIPETAALAGVSLTVTAIADNAFSGMPVQTLTLPASITSIGNGAFMHTNSAMLTSITYLGTTQPSIGTSPVAFPPNTATRWLYLPNAMPSSVNWTPTLWGVAVTRIQFGSGGENPTEFTATVANASFSADGGSETISVYSPVAWNVRAADQGGLNSGISLNPTSGQASAATQVMVTLQANPMSAQRIFTITFENADNGATLKTLTITQAAPGTDGTTYNVTFNAGPATIQPNPPYSVSVAANALLEKPQDPQPINSTYVFQGWFISQAAGAKKWDFDTDRVTGTMTLYGQWSNNPNPNNYTVQYIIDGVIMPNLTVTVQANSLLTKPQDPVKAGYTFNGWWTAINRWNFDTDRVNANMQLVAGWTQNTTGTYIVGGIVYRIQSVGATGTEKVAVAEGTTASVMTNTTVVIPASILVNGTSVPVTEIGTQVFMAFRDVVSVTIPASVTKVSGGSFSQCGKLASITYLGTTDPITVTPTKDFRNSNRVLYVPNATSGFDTNKDFWGTPTIVYGGQTPVVEERTETTATVTWNLIPDAVSYYLYLYSDASKTTELAVYEFDAQGDYVDQLRARSAGADVVPTFNLQGLDLATEYYVEVEAVNDEEEVILAQALVIPTLEDFGGTTNINKIEITTIPVPVAYYSIMGVKLNAAPEKGIYIILYDNGKTKKFIKE